MRHEDLKEFWEAEAKERKRLGVEEPKPLESSDEEMEDCAATQRGRMHAGDGHPSGEMMQRIGLMPASMSMLDKQIEAVMVEVKMLKGRLKEELLSELQSEVERMAEMLKAEPGYRRRV